MILNPIGLSRAMWDIPEMVDPDSLPVPSDAESTEGATFSASSCAAFFDFFFTLVNSRGPGALSLFCLITEPESLVEPLV